MSAAVPYIGSKISLISKSEIRYEGILYTIDTKESTVALQNVRSFGTEARKKEGDQIPPSNEVYDYIIFRGADIKDLHVVETPPQQQIPSARPHDPAIISMQNPATLPHSTPNQGYPYPNYQYGPMSNPQYQMGPWGYSMPPNQYFAPFAPQNQPGQQNPQASVQNQSQRPQQQQQQNAQEKRPQSQQPSQESKPQQPQQPQHQQQPVQEPPKQVRAPEQTQPQQQTQVENQQTSHEQQSQQTSSQPVQNGENSNVQQVHRQQQSHRGRGGNRDGQRNNQGRYNNQDNRGRGGQRRPNTGNRGQAPNGTKSLDEFDLEASNARFEKEKILSEVAAAQADDDRDKAYDKTSSFFDNISCEATDRQKDKPQTLEKRKSDTDMRKLDAETFGMERLNMRGRGGYRGRGGQRRYGYNNNNYNNYNNQNNQNNQNQRDNRQNNQSNSNSSSSHQKQVFRPVSGGSPGNGRDNRSRPENKPQPQ